MLRFQVEVHVANHLISRLTGALESARQKDTHPPLLVKEMPALCALTSLRVASSGVFRSPDAHSAIDCDRVPVVSARQPLAYAVLSSDEIVLEAGWLGVFSITWDLPSKNPCPLSPNVPLIVTGHRNSRALADGEGLWPWERCGSEPKMFSVQRLSGKLWVRAW